MVSTLSQSLAIMYFILALIISVFVVEALPISSTNDGAVILRTRSPRPRIIPEPNASLSDILSDLGINVNVDVLKNAVKNDIADKLHNPKSKTGSDDDAGNVTPTISNTTASTTHGPAKTQDLVQNFMNTLKSALTSVLYDSDEHGLSS